MISFKTVLVGTALSLVISLPAFAQNAQEDAALRQNCSGDYMRLCSNFAPGSVEVEQCFKAKMKELSPGCQGAITAFNKANPKGRQHR
jgi:hypothetical protein